MNSFVSTKTEVLERIEESLSTQSINAHVSCSEAGTPWRARSGFDRCKSQRNDVGLEGDRTERRR